MGFRIFLICILSCLTFIPIASAEVPLKAAFIRNHQLWMAEGNREQQLTKGQYVYSLKWSYDCLFE
ncbi:hypothetical protein RCG23_02475 [Neobacillus sp. PS3-34]|uniref:hypothetical protein n=1 Tax=Neobacillus sp. PS3-34 TaxID=3070678 RepID=UPI0027DEDE86|nr:hypothetical protein [Neobacillus sp. PS3-34]WML48994.1 hypothetical protein RCG23_02475 [Neobacillus sp. PS3-34]